MSLERFLAELADETKSPKHATLLHLSGLTPEEVEEIRVAWPKISPKQRRHIVDRLVEETEDNVDVDFTPLFKFCLKDPDEEVREKVIHGLWECEERSLITTLCNLLRHDLSERARAAAAQGLGKFVSLAEDGKLLPKDAERAKKALLEVLNGTNDESLVVRRRALEAIAPFNTLEVRHLIQEAYETGQSKMRQSAVYAMGRTSDPGWLPIILKELTNDDLAMRFEAAGACGELAEQAAVPHLVPLLKDDDLEVRLAAISALGAIGGMAARKALQACAKSADEAVQRAAEEALQEFELTDDPLSVKFNI